MKLQHIAPAATAVIALGAAATIGVQARTKAEEDAITKQLNLDQLAKSKANSNTMPGATAPATPDMGNAPGTPEAQPMPTPGEGAQDQSKRKPDEYGRSGTMDQDTPPSDKSIPPEEPAPDQSSQPDTQQPEQTPRPNPY